MVRSLVENPKLDLLSYFKEGMDVNVIRDLMDLYNPETPLKRKKELKEKYEVKQFDSNDRDTYPSNKLQLEKIKNNDKLEKHEAMFAAMKPRELGAFHKQEPNKLNFIKKLMNKKNKILKGEGIEVEPTPFQDALSNVQKPLESRVPTPKAEYELFNMLLSNRLYMMKDRTLDFIKQISGKSGDSYNIRETGKFLSDLINELKIKYEIKE
jgi:DNA-binding transcriptional MerR regulator